MGGEDDIIFVRKNCLPTAKERVKTNYLRCVRPHRSERILDMLYAFYDNIPAIRNEGSFVAAP